MDQTIQDTDQVGDQQSHDTQILTRHRAVWQWNRACEAQEDHVARGKRGLTAK